jgi:hypothetical protein
LRKLRNARSRVIAHQSCSLAANRLNDPIDFRVRFRDDEHAHHKTVASCVEVAWASRP